MVIQHRADTHVIWVARHKVTRPQTILKFRPPSSLDSRTRHGSESFDIGCSSTTFWQRVFVTWRVISKRNLLRRQRSVLDTVSSSQLILLWPSSTKWLHCLAFENSVFGYPKRLNWQPELGAVSKQELCIDNTTFYWGELKFAAKLLNCPQKWHLAPKDDI
jgi:hypothetical protein